MLFFFFKSLQKSVCDSEEKGNAYVSICLRVEGSGCCSHFYSVCKGDGSSFKTSWQLNCGGFMTTNVSCTTAACVLVAAYAFPLNVNARMSSTKHRVVSHCPASGTDESTVFLVPITTN